MKKLAIGIWFLFVFNIQSAYSEIYQYNDKEGNALFTDDITKVPEEQRPDVKSQQELKPAPDSVDSAPSADERTSGSETGEKTGASKDDSSKISDEKKKADTAAEVLAEKKKEIEEKTQTLRAESNALEQESLAIEEDKKNVKTAADNTAYKKRLAEYNQRVDQHNAKQKELGVQIDSYNSEPGVSKAPETQKKDVQP